MQFAVVDIETTGGYAAENGITEISVFVTDGYAIRDSFYAMLNPGVPIPSFIESLTGISNEMVMDKAGFDSIAEELFDILKDKIFVAHNVNFDYSFVRHHLAENGFHLNCKKLCTIRLSRRVVPGLKGYGLDKICNHLKIKIENRHSASGDALATTELLHLLIQKGGLTHVSQMLHGAAAEMSLPPNLSEKNLKELPDKPGVYYFHNKKGKIIYVGKAKRIRRRVKSHFTNNKPGRQKQEFLKSIYRVTYQETATELMALVLEGIEIKTRWPEQNRSQKKPEQMYGLYSYTDAAGYKRLFIEKGGRNIRPHYTFGVLTEAYSLLRKLITDYQLCPYLCFLTPKSELCNLNGMMCRGACHKQESPGEYNARVDQCVDELEQNLPSFAIFDKGLRDGESSCILVENGRLSAMGYVPSDGEKELSVLKSALVTYPDNYYVRSLILKFANQHPHQTFSFAGMSFSK